MNFVRSSNVNWPQATLGLLVLCGSGPGPFHVYTPKQNPVSLAYRAVKKRGAVRRMHPAGGDPCRW
jgi:hypothetical protein